MELLYATIDEVHLALARRIAGRLGITIVPHEPRDGPLPQDTLGIADADFWAFTDTERRRLVRELCARPSSANVAVHGYRLTRGERAALRRAGVPVARRLSRRLLAALLDRRGAPLA